MIADRIERESAVDIGGVVGGILDPEVAVLLALLRGISVQAVTPHLVRRGIGRTSPLRPTLGNSGVRAVRVCVAVDVLADVDGSVAVILQPLADLLVSGVLFPGDKAAIRGEIALHAVVVWVGTAELRGT